MLFSQVALTTVMPCCLVFPKKTISRLQLLQNSAARVLTRARRWVPITPVLKSLHWLPVSFRIDFRVLLIAFKSLNGLGPSYLADLLLPYEPSQTLRSSDSSLLIIPIVNTRTHGEAAFQHYTPHLWNSLLQRMLTFLKADSRPIFLIWLKTNLTFNWLWLLWPWPEVCPMDRGGIHASTMHPTLVIFGALPCLGWVVAPYPAAACPLWFFHAQYPYFYFFLSLITNV